MVMWVEASCRTCFSPFRILMSENLDRGGGGFNKDSLQIIVDLLLCATKSIKLHGDIMRSWLNVYGTEDLPSLAGLLSPVT